MGNWRNGVVGLGETQETFRSQYVSSVRGKGGLMVWLVGRGLSTGSNSGGAEGHGWLLVEEEGPVCLGGKVYRRTS